MENTNQKRELNFYRQLKTKIAKCRCHINFLKDCKKFKVFPNFINIKTNGTSEVASRAIRAGKRCWLNGELQNKYKKLAALDLKVYELHLKILKTYFSNNTDFEIEWMQFDRSTNEEINEVFDVQRDKHSKKLRKLKEKNNIEKQEERRMSTITNFIRNESSSTFTSRELDLLNKGLKYGMKPRAPPLEDIIGELESGLERLSYDVKEDIRCEIRRNIEKVPKRAIHNKKEFEVIKTLREKQVVYTKADKGNSIVILDKADYDMRVVKTIEEGPYIEHKWKNNNPRDPLNAMVAQAKATAKYVAEMLMNPQLTHKFQVSNPKVAKLYALPKIHKAGNKMRPIADNTNTPTVKMAEWLIKQLKRYPDPPSLSISNAKELTEKIADLKLEEGEIMVSFDVTALFPNVPVKNAIKVLTDHLKKVKVPTREIKAFQKIAETVMDQNYIQFRGKFYKQSFGVSMGSKLAPYLSNVFMGNLEKKLKRSKLFPRIWLRYVDDIFAVVKEENLENVFKLINSKYDTIKFTTEKEENGKLPFLDLMIKRTENNGVKFAIYRKPTHTDRYLTADSYHCTQHKNAAFHAMAHRLFNIPMDLEDFNREKSYIIEAAKINGYTERYICNIFKRHKQQQYLKMCTTLVSNKKERKRLCVPFYPPITNKIKQILKKYDLELVTTSSNTLQKNICNFKDKDNQEEQSGIYNIECQNCDALYIGQTRRPFKTRLKEHEKAIINRSPEKSAVALHMLENNHSISSNSKIVKPISQIWKLNAYESMYIASTTRPTMNRDDPPMKSKLFRVEALRK